MLQLNKFVFNPFQENTYVIWDENLDCAIIDPGCSNEEEKKALTDFIKYKQLKPTLLLNTHCHIDHILGNEFVSENYQLMLQIHEGELSTYKDTDRWAAMFGLPLFEIPKNLGFINEFDKIKLGNSFLDVIFTPGHSIASVSFYNQENKMLISGDVLFHESIGRTDLPGGNFTILENSIRQKLYILPDPTMVYSGHGIPTTIGHEKKFNPMVSE